MDNNLFEITIEDPVYPEYLLPGQIQSRRNKYHFKQPVYLNIHHSLDSDTPLFDTWMSIMHYNYCDVKVTIKHISRGLELKSYMKLEITENRYLNFRHELFITFTACDNPDFTYVYNIRKVIYKGRWVTIAEISNYLSIIDFFIDKYGPDIDD